MGGKQSAHKKLRVWLLCLMCFYVAACTSTPFPGNSIEIANQRVGLMMGDKVVPMQGERIGYVENQECKDGHPCMALGLAFDVTHFESGATLSCFFVAKANPQEVPNFADYQNGEIKRAFVLDLAQVGSPVLLSVSMQRELGDHGQVQLTWSCSNRGSNLVLATVNVELGE